MVNEALLTWSGSLEDFYIALEINTTEAEAKINRKHVMISDIRPSAIEGDHTLTDPDQTVSNNKGHLVTIQEFSYMGADAPLNLMEHTVTLTNQSKKADSQITDIFLYDNPTEPGTTKRVVPQLNSDDQGPADVLPIDNVQVPSS